jgi:aminopeptidase N
MKTNEPRPIRLRDYRPHPFAVEKAELDISLHPTRTRVYSKLTVVPNKSYTGTRAGLDLDGENLDLESIAVNGKPLAPSEYRTTSQALTIKKPPARRFTVELVTYINPQSNTSLEGLYRSRGIYCTQCEAEGFRRITYFIDRPDNLAVFTTRIEASSEEASVLLGNGNPVERGTKDGGRRHYAVWHDPHPKPSYLFAIVGGNLCSIASTFRTRSGRSVDLRIYVEPGKEGRAGWALDCLKRSMRWDEERFGCEYDLDVFNIVAVSDFNMGAMENKGLNVFNDRLILASPETATDASFAAIESVVAHEYFHNWTGNRITCRDWFQLCLKEGLTVYRDQEFSADARSRPVQRISDVRQLRAHQFPEDAGPLAHPVRPDRYIEINNFYTSTVYEKGAEIVRMIEEILGRDGFAKGMNLYFRRHDGDAATVEQFIKCFEDATGRDLGSLFRWYGQSGTPELVCELAYDARKKQATLTVTQVHAETANGPKKKPVHIPFRIGLLGADGSDIALRLATGEAVPDGLLHLTRTTQKFSFVDVPSRPVASLLRGFSAPVRLSYNLTDRDLEFLMAHDSDLFNRWQAANDYATRTLIQLIRTGRDAKACDQAASFVEALRATLVDNELEHAYRAEMLKLPSEGDLAREIGRNVDPDAIHAARESLLKLIGTRLHTDLDAIYRELSDRAPFSPDAESAGRRALRNMALTYMSHRGRSSDVARLVSHFDGATNMTDESHALYLLADCRGKERQHALDRFHERWSDDHVVIDIWFAAQALSPAASTLGRVRSLMRHPLFSLSAPNKVRALIAAFAASNHVQFNRPDGKGYDFLVEQILALDRSNPQMAARLLSSLKSWQALEPGRRKLAKAALKRVASTENLSRDVYEIVTKILE